MATLAPIVNKGGKPIDPINSGAGLRFLLNPLQETAYVAGVKCRGFTVKQEDGQVTVVIKVLDPKGKPKVAFVTATSYAECLEAWFVALHTKGYSLVWHDDRFA